MTPNEQQVRAAHSAWIEAVNAGDLNRLQALMADDVVFVSPGGDPFGRETFASNFASACQQLRFRCRSDLEEVVVAGDVAYTRARDILDLAPRAGGDQSQLTGHRVTIYRRQPDGRWLLARDIHTLSAAKQ